MKKFSVLFLAVMALSFLLPTVAGAQTISTAHQDLFLEAELVESPRHPAAEELLISGT